VGNFINQLEIMKIMKPLMLKRAAGSQVNTSSGTAMAYAMAFINSDDEKLMGSIPNCK
jgi:hypothetical protein